MRVSVPGIVVMLVGMVACPACGLLSPQTDSAQYAVLASVDELLGVGMAPFFYMPHVIFVAERGLGHFDLSMRAQHESAGKLNISKSTWSHM